MNKYNSAFLSFRYIASILVGLFLMIFGCFYFFDVSAKSESVKELPEQNLTNGRLVFSRTAFSGGGISGVIATSNPDGTGESGIASTQSIPYGPTWSPDGTKIAYFGNGDIYSVNANGTGETNLTNAPAQYGFPSWSVTGKIAYDRRVPNNAPPEVWTMNDDGTGQAKFSAITQTSPSSPVWSPDGSKLAFLSGGEIWVIDANGTNEHRITTNATTDTDPAWSPDGSKIIFTRGTTGIGVINADGTNEMNLTTVTNDKQPSWSPDGTKIAFRRTSTNAGLYTMDANGANQVRIIADVITVIPSTQTIREDPEWQPVTQTPNTFVISGRVTHNNLPVIGATVNLSGTTNAAATTDAVGNYQFSGLSAGGNYKVSPSELRTYFTPANNSFNNLTSNQTADFEVGGVCVGGRCVKNGKIAYSRSGDIFVINPDGTNQTNITNNAAGNNEPNYSPDGLKIIFTTNRDGNSEIYRMDEDGINPVRLTNNTASDSSPYYSPDGTTIVFASDRDGNSEIYKMNADGTNQVRLTNNTSSDKQPAFSPDGTKIIFVNRDSSGGGAPNVNLWTMNADGTNPQPVTNTGGFAPLYDSPSYSPDGFKIIFTYTSDTSFQPPTIYTMNPDGTNRVLFPAGGTFGSYSPDGTKLTYTCCTFNNTNRVLTANANGNSVQTLTPSNTGNDYPDWQAIPVTRRTSFDFDGDGRSDISVFRPSNGAWYISRSTAGLWVPVWGLSTDVLVPADYDGDLKTDVAVWRPSSGDFYILNSFDHTVRIENFGLAGDIPTGGDWDGDGKADVAVYREGANGTFYYRGSMGNPLGNITFIPWGISGDKPVVGDYDGDGRTDAAIYRNGIWYIRQSSNGQLTASSFGLADDKLVPADYDADGKTDLAVYRGGTWYLLRSAQGFTAFQFGISSDIPAPADYDGDGRADAAVYRNGVWWILNSQSGTAEAVSFGGASDAPVPSAFVR